MILGPTCDAQAMAAVHALAFEAAWCAADLETLLDSPGVFALAVQAEDGMAGFVLCRAVAGEAEILTLAVSPEYRRRGLATSLVEGGAAAARALGADEMFLEVAADNEVALRLYAAAGFHPAGRRAAYYSRANGPVDALVLRRDLNRGRAGPYD